MKLSKNASPQQTAAVVRTLLEMMDEHGLDTLPRSVLVRVVERCDELIRRK